MLQAKKMLVMNILNILKDYTDENHTLTQQDIIKILEKDYDMTVERKAVKRNIDNLIEEGHDINYREVERGKGKNKNTLTTDYYMLREFEDSELRLLIDSVMFSRIVPRNQCKQLIKKLEGLSSKYFKSRVKHIEIFKDNEITNPDLFYNIGIIDEAITKNKKITFNYASYDKNKKLVPRKDKEGNDRIYRATPLQMVAANGKYYLVCVFDSHEDDISNIRIDKIQNIKLSEEKGNQKEITQNKLNNLMNDLLGNVYMYTGKLEWVDFKFKKNKINEIIDIFGPEVKIYEEKNDKDNLYGQVKTNLTSMKYCAMQYADVLTVLEPSSLVKEIKTLLKEISKNYK